MDSYLSRMLSIFSEFIPGRRRISAQVTAGARGNASPPLDVVADEAFENRSHKDLFEELVRINRANGVDPTEEEFGSVVYPHGDLVPMQGDTYWSNKRTISRQKIDRRFRNATI